METKNIKIEGYECVLCKFKSGWFSIRVPMGEIEQDKMMFDKLVYYNKKIYNGQSEKEVIEKVGQFIKDYKTNFK